MSRTALVAVSVLMLVTSCSIGGHAVEKGPDACAVFGQVRVMLEEGSLTVAQAEPELRRALKLAGEAAAGGEVRWHDLAVALQQMAEAQGELAAFHVADDRAWETCAPVVGT